MASDERLQRKFAGSNAVCLKIRCSTLVPIPKLPADPEDAVTAGPSV
jgi:hypothetical protein